VEREYSGLGIRCQIWEGARGAGSTCLVLVSGADAARIALEVNCSTDEIGRRVLRSVRGVRGLRVLRLARGKRARQVERELRRNPFQRSRERRAQFAGTAWRCGG